MAEGAVRLVLSNRRIVLSRLERGRVGHGLEIELGRVARRALLGSHESLRRVHEAVAAVAVGHGVALDPELGVREDRMTAFTAVIARDVNAMIEDQTVRHELRDLVMAVEALSGIHGPIELDRQ